MGDSWKKKWQIWLDSKIQRKNWNLCRLSVVLKPLASLTSKSQFKFNTKRLRNFHSPEKTTTKFKRKIVEAKLTESSIFFLASSTKITFCCFLDLKFSPKTFLLLSLLWCRKELCSIKKFRKSTSAPQTSKY